MKTAYIHIGTPKTGTTSIQKFLYKNKSILLYNNFLYPESFILNKEYDPQHWDLSILCNNYKDSIVDKKIMLLKKEINTSCVDNILISSEAFWAMIDSQHSVLNLKKILNF